MSSTDATQDLQAFHIAGLPPDFYYIPNFLTVEEEASILNKVRKLRDLSQVTSRPMLPHHKIFFQWLY
jgi:hypothetical protein